MTRTCLTHRIFNPLAVALSTLVTVDACADDSSRERTRLQVVGIDGGGGAVSYEGVDDLRLGVACAPALAEDGAVRCLPLSVLIELFADARCEDRVALSADPESAPRYVAARDPFACAPTPTPVFEITDEVVAGRLYQMVNGACVSAYLQPGTLEARRVERVPPDTFVELTEVVESVAVGLERRSYRTADGGSYFASLWDTANGRSCELREANGAAYCAPFADGHVFATEGPTCDGRALAVMRPTACPASVAFASAGDPACAAEPILVRVGSRVEDPTAYSAQSSVRGGLCASIPAGVPLYEAQREDPADVLVALESDLEGSGRLRARYPVGDNGAVLTRTRATFFDTERGADCVPYASFGAVYCIPRHARIVARLYADEGCQTPVDVVRTSSASGIRYGIGPDRALYELADPVDEAERMWTLDAAGECAGYTPPSVRCGGLVRLGRRVDLSSSFLPLVYGPL